MKPAACSIARAGARLGPSVIAPLCHLPDVHSSHPATRQVEFKPT